MLELFGVPFDLGGKWLGSRLGPDALRLAGLPDSLRALGHQVADLGDLARRSESNVEGGVRNIGPLTECVRELRLAVEASFDRGATPIVMGGEHTIALGGASAAINRFEAVSVLWIDAHADINTPATSMSGNLHGMPIAALWGLPSGTGGIQDQQWRDLCSTIGPKRLEPSRTAWVGLRELDTGEAATVQSSPDSLPITMDQLDRIGIFECVGKVHAWLVANGTRHLWISFDVDALDPIFAPGTGTAVRGGLTYREAHLLAETLFERLAQSDCPYKLAGIDVVEANPIRDTTNMTSLVASEWVASLFGKTILGKR